MLARLTCLPLPAFVFCPLYAITSLARFTLGFYVYCFPTCRTSHVLLSLNTWASLLAAPACNSALFSLLGGFCPHQHFGLAQGPAMPSVSPLLTNKGVTILPHLSLTTPSSSSPLGPGLLTPRHPSGCLCSLPSRQTLPKARPPWPALCHT